jgi:threonine dehydrogenase-like Zn-dependent dehydrogenase
MKAETAALAQSVAAALHAVRTGLVDARGFVTVLGDGPMAMLTARVALSLNGSVRLLGKHPDRVTLCERMGIKHRHIAEAGKRHDQQVVLDCTGDTSADGLSTAAGLAAPRSRIVVKAPPVPIPGRDVPISSASLKLAAASEVTIVGAAAGQLREGLGWLQKNKLDESIVLSRRVPWSRAIEGLDSLHDRRVLSCLIEMP